MDKELIYLAGLFDGEGCVSINKVTARRYKRPGFQLRTSVSITDEQAALDFQNRFGGKVYKRTKARAAPYWMWVTVARQSLAFLNEIEPFLRIKKEVALVGIDFQSYRDANQSQNKSDEYWNREFECYEKVRFCNARWGTEYYRGP